MTDQDTSGQSRIANAAREHALNVKFIADTIARLEQLDNTTRGVFAETLVGHLLGDARAHPDPYGPWDLTWEDSTIQVKCSGQFQAWHLNDSTPSPALWNAPLRRAMNDAGVAVGDPLHGADVWVFARHEGRNHLRGWGFWVVPTRSLAGGPARITPSRLIAIGAVHIDQNDHPDALRQAVRAAAQLP